MGGRAWTVRSGRSPGEILDRMREMPGRVDDRGGVFRVRARGAALRGRVRALPLGTEVVLQFEGAGVTRRDAAGWAVLGTWWAIALFDLLPSAAVPATSQGLLLASAGALTAWTLGLEALLAVRAFRDRHWLRREVEQSLI